ncbi:MAG: Endolytic peptidoglycan transglycosylase RlpA [Chroococcopsis gigantea SAG 12.99]|jgi:rare lipoprotein A|nr:septal ring lytic transglycosylase RlpA family protein [Chlorogloea purpurea SAG 13.99]MDV3000979.1 Endolytic peptidoglycan transglycosylase RlpA [Chroococcopsis gigantea SAG 12.99]
MKKQLKLTILTLSTVMGTTASLISSQSVVLADSLTNTTTARLTASNIKEVANLPDCQTNRAIEPINNLSQVQPFCDNEILRNIENSLPQEVAPKPAKAKKVTPSDNADAPLKGRAKKQGMASWYGPGFHGGRTASGESFNAYGNTAAHPYLPFGTRVKVTNLNNGRSVVVRINDRGPHLRSRIIDLSKGAASIIGVFQSGVAPVLLEVLGR